MSMITVLEIILNSQAAADTLQMMATGGLLIGFIVCLVQLA